MITIGYSTRKIDNSYIEHIKKTCGNKKVQIIPVENNGEFSLTQVYNKILDEAENDIVVFCHDDLNFETTGWMYKLKSHFDKNPEYGIIGLAGTKYLPPSGKWWELQSAMYGIVNHKLEKRQWESRYSKDIGNKLEPTIIVDGLFFAINKKNIVERFDESVQGFHFYDVDFSFRNYLKNVKIGICTDIRVTHLSIGQTNEQWESNREIFAEKFSEKLPIDITEPEKHVKTFIFIHDQDLLLEFEKIKKFIGFNGYRYVFVGNRPIDKIEDIPNVIISRNYEGNLESYPQLTSFTGWYTLWKHNLIDSEYVNLFEYDINYVPNFETNMHKFYYDKQDIIGYIPFSSSHQMFIQHPPFIETLFKTIKKIYRVDIQKVLMTAINSGNMGHWSSTSNTTFRKNIFDQYMNWILPMIDEIKIDPNAGHLHERSITIFASMKNKKLILTNGFLKHYQMDSHKTQGHYVDEKSVINQLLQNKIQ
jgi:hypothetical protein